MRMFRDIASLNSGPQLPSCNCCGILSTTAKHMYIQYTKAEQSYLDWLRQKRVQAREMKDGLNEQYPKMTGPSTPNRDASNLTSTPKRGLLNAVHESLASVTAIVTGAFCDAFARGQI
jgi:hypothetical protein